MATMKNKQTARKMTIDAEKLDEILSMVHTQQQKQKDEIKRLTHNYQDAVKQIAILEDENDKLHKTILRWQEKADFNLTDSDDD